MASYKYTADMHTSETLRDIMVAMYLKYDHALLLDPANKKALKMIKKINQ